MRSAALALVVVACGLVLVAADVTQIISIELGGAAPAFAMVHVDPWTGKVLMRVPIAAARNLTHAAIMATHSPASPIAPFTFSIIINAAADHGNHTLIPLNARTLQPSGAHPESTIHSDVTGLMYDAVTSLLVGFEVDRTVQPHTHYFGKLDYATGKMVRAQQIPAPYSPRLEYDYVLNDEAGEVYVILTDLHSCAFAVIDIRHPETKPKITPLPNKTCLHKLMWVPPPAAGKPGVLLSFCQPEFPRYHNATLCIVDPATAKTTAVSHVFHEEGDNFHTAVAFQPGWVFAAGLAHGRQWLFNYEAKNVSELANRVPPGRFFVGGNSFTL